jgi:hypothetical protein
MVIVQCALALRVCRVLLIVDPLPAAFLSHEDFPFFRICQLALPEAPLRESVREPFCFSHRRCARSWI